MNSCLFSGRKWGFAVVAVALIALVAAEAIAEPLPNIQSPSKADVETAQSVVKATARELEELSLSVDSLNDKIEVADGRVKRLNEKSVRARAKFDEKNLYYGRRLVVLYKSKQYGSIDFLLRSSDITSFFTRLRYLSEMSVVDSRLVNEVSAIRSDLEAASGAANDEQIALMSMRSELERKTAAMARKLEDSKAHLQGVTIQLDLARKALATRLAEERKTISIPVGTTPALRMVAVKPLGEEYLATTKMPASFRSTGQTLKGVASWYGNEFNGRRTANGETYNEEDFTAASKELPFGTYLAVTYRDKRIIVRINDRGPFIEGRFLDLSKGAARALGFGLGEVKAEVIKPD